MKTAIINFNGGQFTPKIDARVDTEKYVSGCRQLDNMIPDVFGNATKRPGTELISLASSAYGIGYYGVGNYGGT